MALFTIILEYDGGTYCSQLLAVDAASALRRWAETFEQRMDGFDASICAELRRSVNNDFAADCASLVPMTGIKSVWCWSSNGALVNIVKTAES